jgi:methylase of polypeptide subunit release factors
VTVSTPGAGDPPAVDDPGLTTELREVLVAAGYSGEGVRAALGTSGDVLSRSVDIPLHLRRLEGTEPLGTLIRLLVLDAPTTIDAARRAFAPLPLESVEQLGLVARETGRVRALARIVPHDDLVIASDRRTPPGQPDRPDHVAGVHAPSLTLSRLTVRRPVATALDIGTGCGILAILAAGHSERVVATDVNPRALRFAAFNAQLNGVENLELREGSFFEPVAGETFGLAFCNPPYVISPESAYLFRDSGMAGDAVSRHVGEHMAEHLDDDAFASMLVSWVVEPDGDWSVPLRSWVEGNGCDAWLLHHGTQDPLTHAGSWLRHEVGADPVAYAAALERWLAYFDREEIVEIAVGAVVLRRRSGAGNWVRADELPSDRLRPASDHILRVFEAQDYLSGIGDDAALLGERLALAETALLEQRATYRDGEWSVDEITLSLEDGLGFHASVDPTVAAMLAGLDGARTLGEIAAELAEAEDAGRELVERALVPVAREMLGAGFLVRR